MSLDITLECPSCGSNLFTVNITHNLNKMAREATLYLPMWRPDDIGIDTAEQLIEPLRTGLEVLEDDPEHFELFDADNGWGEYHDLQMAATDLLTEAIEHPDARVVVSR